MIGKDAAIHHCRVNPASLDLIDLQRNHAIVKQQHIAADDVLVQTVEGNANAFNRAIFESKLAVQEKRCAVREFDTALFKAPHTNFRPLQIGHQADFPARLP